MATPRVVLGALFCGLAVAVIPWLLPTGPDAGLDAAQFLAADRFLVGAAVVFFGGLLTAMTPCVYPLIPITVSVFGARKAESRGRSLLLTSAYVVGMGVVFSALGVLAAKTGQAFGSMLGNPWVVSGLAVFLSVLATSMFGAFELALPSSWAGKLNNVGGAGLAGAFLMGSVSGFLAAPCTGPVLTGLLAFVAKTQSTVLGGSLLFLYALGIGVPFFLIGVFTVRLPKGGVWMEWVKSVLGIVLVALAVTYLKDAFPAVREALGGVAEELGRVPGTWIAAALTSIGILFGAVHLSFKEGARQFVLKGAGVLLVVSAILLRVGALNAGSAGELWARMGWMKAEEKPVLTWHLTFAPSGEPTTLTSFDEQLATARASGKPVMIDFGAEWCAACKELERITYVAPQVVREAGRFVNIKVDATNEDDSITSLYERFGVQGLPTVAFVSSSGEILNDPRVTGFLNAEKFLTELRKVR
jgi:thiol:disulfide interchange protein DsbD